MTARDLDDRAASRSVRKPTMADVAKYAGVSLKTVSRVVNQEPHVRAPLQERVQAAISALGYRRNEAAARLARGAAMLTLGLVMENISNEFYSRLAAAVESAAAGHEALVVFGSYEESADKERMLIESMYARGVDSLIVVPSAADHAWLAEHASLTAVFVDRVPPGLDSADVVLLDDVWGGRAATEHLLAHGHRRIALISDDGAVSSVRDRAAGYRAALRAAGVAADEAMVVRGVFDPWRVAYEVGRLLDLPDPPTAFFATNNRAAIGILQALRERPERPAYVGFDDFALADVFSPGVTVVRYDVTRLARGAVDLLLNPAPGPRRVRVPVELIARGSGELPPR
ncbi:LacI family DNA-binding transcriptional regulator [Nonomuraea phyllanthi]|uniref:LacI family DNA-binding transcriptional regulator n=1 Tax=Nonomuraea phyllanthi TaxID=2219224 RepID=A0A5C4V3G7_9ACTN|nr:LacI family DNA-binding transcriptional regulator [Nonomuraea phyllanthi]KAB8185746.1 LacI family DNA-binding transcriptional regulator [Nonomuraea phyllanthi]QFY11186.1 LacI family DNA-binding transcriptional regulator [Nonomuraea phyllanthi]